MPNELPQNVIDTAEAAAAFAAQTRRYHARRTQKNSQQRQDDIEGALGRIREAMKPLRSEIGRFPYGPQTDLAESNRERIRELSAALQAERRKLWKMQRAKRAAA